MSHPDPTHPPATRSPDRRTRLELHRRGKDVHGRRQDRREVGRSHRTEGMAGMADRSSRPHHSPSNTSPVPVRQIARLRWRHRLGPVQIAGRLDLPASTLHAAPVRCRIHRLNPLRRYEHAYPGSLIHVDVTKFGNIPDGGGHRFVGRAKASATNAPPPGCPAAPTASPAPACCTPSSMTTRASPTKPHRRNRSHRHRGIAPGSGLVSRPRRHRRTGPARPYRPQTNGKIERFHRTLAEGRAMPASVPASSNAEQRYQAGAALLQSPPTPQLNRRQATGHPADPPLRTSHLPAGPSPDRGR